MDESTGGAGFVRRQRIRGLVEAARQQAGAVHRLPHGPAHASDTDDSAASYAARADETTCLATALSGYSDLRLLHRGGQGLVYRAVQRSTQRVVAIKVLREGPLASHADRARFEREARILARLRHPDIVAIHDSGEALGHFFLVMDYFDGQPLDEHVSTSGRDIRATLRLMLRVCDAVAAAHLRGVLHRDLKPGNILVDREGDPHVLDFGLGKFADTADSDAAMVATMTGQFIGSLPWCSPEQAAGTDVDVRTDVYSLGVLLFQLLTGAFPYCVLGPPSEILERVRNQSPVRPRTLRRELNDEVETILLTCLQKEPQRRYQSAAELAADLRRYLAGEAIAAKRDSLSYVVRKTLRRHRSWVCISGFLLCVVCCAAVISTVSWHRALRDRDQALRAGQKEQQARQQADIQAATAGAVMSFLQTMLSSADPAVSQGRELTVREVLDQAAQDVDRGALSEQPAAAAAVRLTLGRAYLSLGQLDIAAQQLDHSLQLAEQTSGIDSKPYADVLHTRGVLMRQRGDLAASESIQREAASIYRGLSPPVPEQLGESLSELASVLDLSGRRAESVTVTSEALDLYRSTLGPNHALIAGLESHLAAREHHHEDALGLAERALANVRAAFGEKHPQVAYAYSRLAGALHGKLDLPAATDARQKALELFQELYGDESPETLDAALELILVHELRGQLEEAVALSERFLPAAEKLYGHCNEVRLRHLCCMARTARKCGDPIAAEHTYRYIADGASCHEWLQTAAGRSAQLSLAELLIDRGAEEEAAPLIQQQRLFLEENPGSEPPTGTGRIECAWGQILASRASFAEAETHLLKAHQCFSKSRLSNAAHRARVMAVLVALYEKWDEVEPGRDYDTQAQVWRKQLAALQAMPSPQ